MAWHQLGDKPLSEPMMIRLPTHICVTQPQWVKIKIKNIYVKFELNINSLHSRKWLKMPSAKYFSVWKFLRIHYHWCHRQSRKWFETAICKMFLCMKMLNNSASLVSLPFAQLEMLFYILYYSKMVVRHGNYVINIFACFKKIENNQRDNGNISFCILYK